MDGPEPFSNTYGFGADAEQLPILDRIEDFFAKHKFSSTITLNCEAPYPIIDALRERRYGLVTFNPLYVYRLGQQIENTTSQDPRILEAKEQSEIQDWQRIVFGGFTNQEPCEADPIAVGQAKKLYLAEIDGELAAGASL